MAKSTYWFKHDYEPTADPKMQALLAEYGGIGYGVYWRLIEMLHTEDEHRLPHKQYLYIAIAKQMQANAEQIEAMVKHCIYICELFESDGQYFWSNRVFRNVEAQEVLSKKRSEAGKKGGLKANAKQVQANAKQNEAEENRIEENREEINTHSHTNAPEVLTHSYPKAFKEVLDLANMRGFNEVVAERFWTKMKTDGWCVMRGGQFVKLQNWQAHFNYLAPMIKSDLERDALRTEREQANLAAAKARIPDEAKPRLWHTPKQEETI